MKHITRKTKSEYCDYPKVLKQKIIQLTKLILNSKNVVVYTGAGISTAAGIGDVATDRYTDKNINRLKALPTFAHHAITKLFKMKLIKH